MEQHSKRDQRQGRTADGDQSARRVRAPPGDDLARKLEAPIRRDHAIRG
jgi:hypothetical protein